MAQTELLEAPGVVASVDPIAAEGLLSAVRLGERIKKLRLRRSMGLVELGKKTGLSASFLSQLETGRVVPTLRNLSRIALVFDKDLSFFFESGEHRVFRIQRKADRVRIPVGAPTPNYIAESFGILVPEGGLRPCMAEFCPGAERDPFQPERYPGIEMVYVLSGSIELQRRGEVHLLESRDVLYISGTTQRSYRCHGTQPAQALIISFDSEGGEFAAQAGESGYSVGRWGLSVWRNQEPIFGRIEVSFLQGVPLCPLPRFPSPPQFPPTLPRSPTG